MWGFRRVRSPGESDTTVARGQSRANGFSRAQRPARRRRRRAPHVCVWRRTKILDRGQPVDECTSCYDLIVAGPV